MRQIPAKEITKAIKNLCIQANTELTADVKRALKKALAQETSKTGQEILKQILQNAKIAKAEKLPICQDCGLAFVFLEIGQEVSIVGNLTKAINKGVKQGYQQGYLRKSVADPLTRKNTNSNTPSLLHSELIPGDKLKITLMTKGGGAENCSAIKMFKPTSTLKEIEAFIVETVKNNGANACP
ncbi:MAG: fumarate hydratase, partial [Candidatus Margulisbacteria bacterium]|nr:fumarate hydratase [Candidatus Margulisiibacteriota bacterium]